METDARNGRAKMKIDLLKMQQVNTVGFYQLSKICITPAVLIFDAVTSKTYPTRKEIAAVCILCIGVTLATVADGSVSTNLMGFLIAVAAICTTAVYQVLHKTQWI